MVYLDNNATTRPDPEVVEAMLPYLREEFANPASLYTAGRTAALAVDAAREQCASLIGVTPEEIFFTSGGTESNNTAIHAALRRMPRKNRVVFTGVEHASIRNACLHLEQEGIQTTVLPVDRDGQLDIDRYIEALSDEVALVSMMTANNETGLLLPVQSCCAEAHARGILFHTDAVQAAGKIPLDACALGVDFLSLSAHKFHGPKGVGILYARKGIPIDPLLSGGGQEQGRRAGTLNVPGIVGMGQAAVLAASGLAIHGERIRDMRDVFERGLVSLPYSLTIVGRGFPRLPNTSDVIFHGLPAEVVVTLLDMEGVCCSPGSACAAGTAEPSRVLEAMGFERADTGSGVRFSLGRFNVMDDVHYVLQKLASVIERVRGTGGEASGADAENTA